MARKYQSLALRASRKALVPIMRFLIRFGATYRDFARIAKLAVLDAAIVELNAKGQLVNKSSLSKLTGLTRREITTLHEEQEQSPPLRDLRAPASELLSQWATNPEFSEKDGKPAILAIEGSNRSLESIFARLGSNHQFDHVIDELIQTGSIERVDENSARLLDRACIQIGETTSSIYHFERTLFTVGSTLVANVTSAGEESTLIERASFTYGLKPLSLPKFLLLTRSASQNFVELVDEWISSNEDKSRRTNGEFVTGVGVYAFHVRDNDESFDTLIL